MARLAAYVHVQDAQGATHVFGPEDEVPSWAAKAITNPKAWADKPAEQEPNGDQAPAGEPPRGGAGSGRDAWAAYATEKGVTVPDDASRDDIIAALVEAGIVEAE